jgi:hypothetical protein
MPYLTKAVLWKLLPYLVTTKVFSPTPNETARYHALMDYHNIVSRYFATMVSVALNAYGRTTALEGASEVVKAANADLAGNGSQCRLGVRIPDGQGTILVRTLSLDAIPQSLGAG